MWALHAVSKFHQVFENSPQQSRHVLGRQMGWRWLGASRCLIEDIGTWEDAGYRKRGERVPQGIEGLGWGVSEAHTIKKSVNSMCLIHPLNPTI